MQSIACEVPSRNYIELSFGVLSPIAEPLATFLPLPLPPPCSAGWGLWFAGGHSADGRVPTSTMLPRSPIGSGGLGGEGQDQPRIRV
jgi:hypothetical protein